jgi:hypothetical protein
MNTHRCCETETRGRDNARRPASRWRRGGEITSWLLPSAMLALLPKCPACVVGYVALVTGLGISVTTAAHLRTIFVVLCMVSLGFVAARRLWRSMARGSGIPWEKEEAS